MPFNEAEKGAKLSEREMQVLTLTAEGFMGKQIADKLDVNLKSVQEYTRRVVKKMGARNRVQAAVMAAKQGLV